MVIFILRLQKSTVLPLRLMKNHTCVALQKMSEHHILFYTPNE